MSDASRGPIVGTVSHEEEAAAESRLARKNAILGWTVGLIALFILALSIYMMVFHSFTPFEGQDLFRSQ